MPTPVILGEMSAFASQFASWSANALPNFIAASIMLVIGWWLASWTQRALGLLLDRQSRIDATLRTVVTSLARYAILGLVVLAVLEQLGIQTTSVLAAFGAIGLAIGLAMQNTLSNIAAGIMLLWLRPFKIGDKIQAGEVNGTLKEFGLFACQLETWDGVFQFVPNSELWNKRVTNFSRWPTRLLDLSFRIDYEFGVDEARQRLVAMATADARVRSEPAPKVYVADVTDKVMVTLRVSVAAGDYANLRQDLLERGMHVLERRQELGFGR
jgi:small conductance mechanosensitive channel